MASSVFFSRMSSLSLSSVMSAGATVRNLEKSSTLPWPPLPLPLLLQCGVGKKGRRGERSKHWLHGSSARGIFALMPLNTHP